MKCTTDKEIQLRKFLYARLIHCLVLGAKFRATGSDEWAEFYREQARLIRKRILRKKVIHPIYRCVVFYPEKDGWKGTEFFTSRPEVAGVISNGMQSMIDDLLCKRERLAA